MLADTRATESNVKSSRQPTLVVQSVVLERSLPFNQMNRQHLL